MQPLCMSKMKIVRELLEFGVLREGAENLAKLRDCACHAGCDRRHVCASLIENQWQSAKSPRPLQRASVKA